MSPTSYQAAPSRVRLLLYFLSINWLRELDLNQRPSGYEPDELPSCSIPRPILMIYKIGYPFEYHHLGFKLVAGAGFEPTTFGL
ncbi:bacteriophage replication protein [Shewanella decolorationis S12]|uniref:Bacteriophage replication protein n=1 Tax=Shewanella decolorationis S12 TaxID=1353536 RepID=A0ABP2Z779_9GAMM|nr:bacteriophage replication protein [Shewanella decolorationis S12]